MRIPVTLLAVLAVLTPARTLVATQHLVAAGERWGDLADRLKPGDEVILMPGRHRPGVLTDVTGTARQPIVLRSADPDHPSVIAAEREGVILVRPSFVTIADLTIEGATVCGLGIENGPVITSTEEPALERWEANVVIRNVHINRTGPVGKRNAIKLNGVTKVRIESTRIFGWGGAAIAVQGSQDIQIEECVLIGDDEHSQHSGIHLFGGTEQVRIDECRLQRAGERAVSIGIDTKISDFLPPVAEKADSSTRSAASDIRVTQCVIIDSDIAFAFDRATNCRIKNNTVIRPRRWVLSVRDSQEHADIRVSGVRHVTFGSNLIAWQPGDLEKLADADPSEDAKRFILEENLWWSPEPDDARAQLGDPPGTSKWPQVMDLDPQLDEELRPRANRAQLFGAVSP